MSNTFSASFSYPFLVFVTRMYGANFVLLSRHSNMYDQVLKWALLCTLDPRCISPPGSRASCHFPKGFLTLKNSTYYVGHGCHRFDQSAFNVMLALYSNFTTDSLTHRNRCMKLVKHLRKNVIEKINNCIQHKGNSRHRMKWKSAPISCANVDSN